VALGHGRAGFRSIRKDGQTEKFPVSDKAAFRVRFFSVARQQAVRLRRPGVNPKKENGIGKSRETHCGIKDYIPMGCHLRSSSLSDGNLMKIKELEMKRRFHFPF
jgi:hypothetical protein